MSETPSTALVPVTSADVEAVADPAAYVVLACERAKAWLADALEHGDIEQIVELRSQAEAIRVYTAQKQLGKDAELAAAEIVRRAERGIGLAIRKGQELGEIRKAGESGGSRTDYVRNGRPVRASVQSVSHSKNSPREFLADTHEARDVYAMTDGVPDTAFDAAIDEGKAEGNLSRANVVRKVRGGGEWMPASTDRGPTAAARRREVIRELAGKAWTSRQIGERLGMQPAPVREIARDEGIAIPADEVVGVRTRTAVDSSRIVRETVNSLEGLEIALSLVRFDELSLDEVKNWTTSLTASIRVLSRLNKQLKEMVQ